MSFPIFRESVPKPMTFRSFVYHRGYLKKNTVIILRNGRHDEVFITLSSGNIKSMQEDSPSTFEKLLDCYVSDIVFEQGSRVFSLCREWN